MAHYIYKTLKASIMKHKYIIISVVLIIITVFFTECNEIIEEDISKKEVEIIAPSDGIETTIINQTFMWKEVEGVNYYNLRIVTPSFDAIEKIVLDTNISGIDTLNISDKKFNFTLNPGDYEWRLLAINSTSEISSGIMHLKITETTDMSGFVVNLKGPSGETDQTKDLKFSWNNLYNASYYVFELRIDEWSSGSIIIRQEGITNTEYIVDHLDNGKYAWGIKAKNDTSSTEFSTMSLTIDSIPPDQPELIKPENNDFIFDTIVDFTWNRDDDQGTEINDLLYIYTDSSLNNLYDTVNATSKSVDDYLFDEQGEYFWYVGSKDEAGNESESSGVFKFTLDF